MQEQRVCSTTELRNKRCLPCEGGVAAYSADAAQAQISLLEGWRLTHDGQRIRKDWRLKNFLAALAFFQEVAKIAEEDAHHPDLHLEGYRNVWVEIYTHAIGGLSENDFILAARIDAVQPKVYP